MFTSLALFNILISPLNAFPWVINGLMEAWVSLKRLQAFANLREQDWSKYYAQRRGKSIDALHAKLFLTHWGRVTHLCVSKLTSIASDNGLSPGRRQAIIWNNAGILLIGPLGTNFSEILIEIQTFSLKKICLKMSSAKCRPFCLGLNVLTLYLLNSLLFWGKCEAHWKCKTRMLTQNVPDLSYTIKPLI